MTKLSSPRRTALFFDFDGVVADTEPLHWRSWADLLLPYGYRLEWEEYCSFALGVDDMSVFEILSGRIVMPPVERFVELNCRRKQLVRELSLQSPPISRQTIDLLKSLGEHSIGLVTSSERTEVDPVLGAVNLEGMFDVCVYGEDVTSHKPAPDPYQLAMHKLGVSGGIAFEDSIAGLESARAAGLEPIRVAHPRELASQVANVLTARHER